MQMLYAAKLGLQVQQERVNTIANNIANVNTVGFKSQRVDFKDALYTQMINPADVGSNANLQQGTGVLISATTRDFAAGAPMNTGNALDLYLDGDGFFTVMDGAGQNMYTRNGSFAISAEADGRYLVTAQGYYVLDVNNNRINLGQDAVEINVNAQGVISANGNVLTTMRIMDFPNKGGLSAQGDGCYIETEVSGEPVASQARVKQGANEASNVELSLEFTRLIRAQRAFSLVSRAVTMWDQMAGTANNLRV